MSSSRLSPGSSWRGSTRCCGAAGPASRPRPGRCGSGVWRSISRRAPFFSTAPRSICPATNSICWLTSRRTRGKSSRATRSSEASTTASTTGPIGCSTSACRGCAGNWERMRSIPSESRPSGERVICLFPTRGDMTRHFLGLYLIIILTLAVVSWAQDWLLRAYGKGDPSDTRPVAVAVAAVASELREAPADRWKQRVAGIAAQSGIDMELFATEDIAGRDTLARLARGDIAFMGANSGDTWALKQIDARHILAIKHIEPAARRGALEWTLTLLFYALIALVL